MTTKTHCTWGHEFTPENSYIDGRGYRSCRQCRKDKVYRDRARNKLELKPEYKTNTEIAYSIAQRPKRSRNFNPLDYDASTYYSVMGALRELDVQI